MQRKLTRQPNCQRWLGLFFLLIAAASFCLPQMLLAQASQDKEAQADAYLRQADVLFAARDYAKAIDSYLLASLTAQRKSTLSRAYVQLSLCYFYLNEKENAKSSILKVLEIDARKELYDESYPQDFVDLFNQVKKENTDKLSPIKTEPPAEEPKAPPEEPQKTQQQVPPAKSVIPKADGGGRWEVEIHYSGWTINPAKSVFEDGLTSKVANEVRKIVNDELNGAGGHLVGSSNSESLVVGSEGSNYGLGIRYYPLGRRGALSIGFSLEKTKIKLNMAGPLTQNYADGSVATVESKSYAVTNPFSVNMSFRWDFFPKWRVTPYFAFGFGFGPLDGEVSYNYVGTYRRGSAQQNIQGEEIKTFDQLREQEDIGLDMLIVLQATLGVKGEIYKGFSIMGEVGFWDGLIFRGGAGYRF
jgi:tetratricopeptide (TPR) repeat protein